MFNQYIELIIRVTSIPQGRRIRVRKLRTRGTSMQIIIIKIIVMAGKRKKRVKLNTLAFYARKII